jgi:glyoxylase-like metal-dependent hydrolase (beta-lactamase superfamily II)
MHPNHAHVTRSYADLDAQLTRRLAIAREGGVPDTTVREMEAAGIDREIGVAEIVLPDRDLVPGVEIDTDLGRWQVHETPGHAPSHVVLHSPTAGLLISGDHLLGRVSLYYDFGYTPTRRGVPGQPRPRRRARRGALPRGHARPFRDVRAHVEANRTRVAERLDRVRASLGGGPRTPFEVVEAVAGEVPANVLNWVLSETLCYLRHLEVREEASPGEGEHGVIWTAA